MYPQERSLVKKYKNKPFAIFGVNSDKSSETVKKLVEDKTILWNSILEGGTRGPVATKWGVSGWPTVFVIDHKGIIQGKARGESLDKMVTKLVKLAEADAKKEAKQ